MATINLKDRLLNREVGFTAGTLVVSNVVTSFGAAHFLGDQFPKPFEKLKEFVAKHIVAPHLDLFEKRFNRQLHAADVKEQKHTERLEIPYQGLSQSERIERISRIIVKESTVFLAESALGLALQYAFRGLFKAEINPRELFFTDAGVQLGAMALTVVPPFAKPTEWAYHKLTDLLTKFSGDKKKARESARHFTYVGGPGALAFVATLLVAGKEHASHSR